MHAVSVGEVAIALKLSAKLRELDPDFRCALTTTTTTGYAFAKREAPEWMLVLYNALDFWPIMRRAFAVLRPERIVLVEAEVWPNLAALAEARGIPLALVNARLSPRSERRFRKFRAFVRPIFRRLDLVCVQERGDPERWQAIGVRPETIHEVGSIKYDPSEAAPDSAGPRALLETAGIARTRPIVLGGSTHDGEEEILARAFLELRACLADAFLIIAPRHVERTTEIARMLDSLGLRWVRRSELAGEAAAAGFDALLLDTTGELRAWYGVATVVFVGKSLTTTGGQNPVEPILAGRPVVFGPHMENFAVLSRTLVERRGAVQIAAAGELAGILEALLLDPARCAGLVHEAKAVLAAHHGATVRTAELLLALPRPRRTAL